MNILSTKLKNIDQMADEIAERPNRRLNYKEQSDEHKGKALSADIRSKTDALKLAASRERVDFRNLHQVQQRVYEYMAACEKAESFPSVQGLAAYGFGCSRQWLNRFLKEHPNSNVSQFIEMVKDSFSDILTNQSLYRNCDSVQAIFQMKNNHDFADRLQIEPLQPVDPLGDAPDIDELTKRIAGTVVLDDE